MMRRLDTMRGVSVIRTVHGSVEDRERDTWDDWCDSAFHNGYWFFSQMPLVVFSDQLLWENDIAESSRILPDGGQAPVSTSPLLSGTIVPLEFPDSGRTARWDDDGLEVLDRRLSEFSVLPRGTEYIFGDTSVLGMRWVPAQVMIDY